MGKKKKQEKSKKQKEKLKKSGKLESKAAKAEKNKAEKNKIGSKSAPAKDVPAKSAGSKRAPAKGIPVKRVPAKRRGGDADREARSGAAECFRALGDENRLRILTLLADGELCSGDLLRSMSIVQSTLSHHMKILVEAGIVKCRRQGKWSYYSVDGRMLEMLDGLTELWAQEKKNAKQ